MAINQVKRKRGGNDGNSDNDGNDNDFGNQSLPVAVLPDDFDGIPTDGSQYLAMVRREAALHPSVFHAADNPYAVASSSSTPYVELKSKAQELGIPDSAARAAFIERFKAVREALTHCPEFPGPQSYNNRGRMPKAKFTPAASRAWFRFIFRAEKPFDEEGNPLPKSALSTATQDEDDEEGEDDDGGDPESGAAAESGTAQTAHRAGPRYPTYGLLQRFTVAQFFSLIAAMPYWIPFPPDQMPGGKESDSWSSSSASPSPPSPALHPVTSQWCFAVLARLDSRLTSDEISSLRELARSCIDVIAMRRALVAMFDGTSDSPAVLASEELESGAWMVVTIIAGIWGQSDLWVDAEDSMARVAETSPLPSPGDLAAV